MKHDLASIKIERCANFRKRSDMHLSSQSPTTHWHRKTARTCLEGPFGEVLRATGPMAKTNPFRFSTKYQDHETDLLYYGYRYYNASTGRWLSRDPIGEIGGLNLFGFVNNDPIGHFDLLGMLRKGDKFAISSKGSRIGEVEVTAYFKIPSDGKVSSGTDVGARLEMIPRIDKCSGECYKWRNWIVSQKTDGKYDPAPNREEEDRWKYLDPKITEFRNIIDVNYSKPNPDQWYTLPDFPPGEADQASPCAYTFRDTPRQLMPFGMYSPSPSVQKVEVTFITELVRLSCCTDGNGGEVVLSVQWGFWFTAKENGLL